jgi:hypothetical protein
LINQKERDKRTFELAREYLLDPKMCDICGRVTLDVLDKYLRPEEPPKRLPGIYEHMLESAQNANMVSGVIKGGIEKISNLRPVLCKFEPRRISERYTSAEELLDEIVEKLKPKGKIRRASNSIWPKFCRTALEAAVFLAKFQSAESFYEWAHEFDCDPRARAALPLIIASRVKGLGFALACDFIKELGFENYGKPDVQLINIFVGLGLSDDKDPYKVFCDIARVAKHAGRKATPYAVDKVFWLIGSGKFYKDNFQVKRGKEQFIKFARSKLREA